MLVFLTRIGFDAFAGLRYLESKHDDTFSALLPDSTSFAYVHKMLWNKFCFFLC